MFVVQAVYKGPPRFREFERAMELEYHPHNGDPRASSGEKKPRFRGFERAMGLEYHPLNGDPQPSSGGIKNPRLRGFERTSGTRISSPQWGPAAFKRRNKKIPDFGDLSGRWDSNPRPSPWQGDVLPTEPRPLFEQLELYSGMSETSTLRSHPSFALFATPHPTSSLHFYKLLLYQIPLEWEKRD